MYVNKTHSTNSHLTELLAQKQLPDGFTIYTYNQTQGRGQQGNSWESECGKNMLFSTLIIPQNLLVSKQFILSEIVALAVKRTLDKYTDGIRIKWSNDIYWHDKKIAGILIENAIIGANIKHSIAGIGLNINQIDFCGNAPNPISLAQITSKVFPKRQIMSDILKQIDILKQQIHQPQAIHAEYCANLYRATGMHLYRVNNTVFEAQIHAIKPDGRLVLQKKDNTLCAFYFKEVEFMLPYMV